MRFRGIVINVRAKLANFCDSNGAKRSERCENFPLAISELGYSSNFAVNSYFYASRASEARPVIYIKSIFYASRVSEASTARPVIYIKSNFYASRVSEASTARPVIYLKSNFYASRASEANMARPVIYSKSNF